MGRPPLRHAETLKRRDQVYRLFLTGASQAEIAGKSESASRRSRNMSPRRSSRRHPKSRREAYSALVQEVADSARMAKNHAYKILGDAMRSKNG